MKAVPKFIYFDLDDTLLDHKSAERCALKDVHGHFPFFSEVTLDELVEVYHDINKQQWKLYSAGSIGRSELQRNRFELTLERLGLDTSMHEEIGLNYMQFYRNHWSWVDGAESAFEKIRATYEVGILTNGFSETQKAKFRRFDFYTRARHLVVSEDVGYLKPQAEIFEHATDLSRCKPNEILYVGDSYNSDVKGGSGFGWNVAWYTDNGSAGNHAEAAFVFDDFSTLSEYLNA